MQFCLVKSCRRLLSSSSGFALICALLIFIPITFQTDWNGSRLRLRLGLPQVFSGDEPHYLVLLNSILLDGDLDISNNYLSVHQGSGQAGKRFAGSALDHHTSIYHEDTHHFWSEFYENNPTKWKKDLNGRPTPTLRPGLSLGSVGAAEYSTHPPGLPLLLAPFLYPFRYTDWVEPLAMGMSAVCVFLLCLVLRSLMLELCGSSIHAGLGAWLAVFCTPVWHYSRTFLTEPYLALFMASAYMLYFNSSRLLAQRPPLRWLGIGAVCVIGMLMKPPSAVVILPIVWDGWKKRKFSLVAGLGACLLVGISAVLMLNHQMFGSPWRAPQPFYFGNPISGVHGLLLSWTHGLLWTAPVCLLAFAAIPKLIREVRLRALLPILAGLLYFLMIASWAIWSGGYCYGPRLILPALPLLCLGFCLALRWDQWLVWGIVGVSFVVSGFATLFSPFVWSNNPLAILVIWLIKFITI